MNDNSFSVSSNIFGIIVGSVSLIALAFGLHVNLPSRKIKYLESILDETEKLFQSVLEDGLLPQQEFTSKVENHLYQLREDTIFFRRRVYCVTTYVQDWKELVKGLSSEIGQACHDVKQLRAAIVTSSEAERRNLSARRRAATSSASSPSHVISMDSNATTDHTDDDDASSIPTSEFTESTMVENSECNDEAESFTTADDWSDAISNLGAQPTGPVWPDWRRIWKHGSKHAATLWTRDRVHEVNVGQVPGTITRAIRLGGYYSTVPVQTLPPEALP
ncbi:hypothetical protein F5I97DRAFT_829169 [Phlebopus sp. FC_14]|nr:hypothetical protein F5I97DRAFT_829169 [Phlebopus sp. FC_14]